MEVSELDLAWAAGMFEGEGSVRINKPTKRNIGNLLVDMVNTDEVIVRWFQERWPGHYRLNHPTGNRKRFWRWRIAARNAAVFLRAIQPYLKAEKRERVALGIEFQDQKVMRGQGNRTDEYRARQWSYYERMKILNERGVPRGTQLRLIAVSAKNRDMRLLENRGNRWCSTTSTNEGER